MVTADGRRETAPGERRGRAAKPTLLVASHVALGWHQAVALAFDVGAATANVVLQLALRRQERVPDSDVWVRVLDAAVGRGGRR